ncbi:arsenical resistance operon repressor [Dehalogenimonas sp. WBC-2]|nr:arsenical resistance operon repressor [Dehalogenimonas sp. WBC-2]
MRIYNNKLERLADQLKALADETRLRIMNLIIERECCVCEVMQALGISQTRASRNLSQLYDAGLLEQRRDGLWTIYYLDSGSGTGHHALLVSAVEQGLKNDALSTADRRRLRESKRLCPPSGLPHSSQGDLAQPENVRCP